MTDNQSNPARVGILLGDSARVNVQPMRAGLFREQVMTPKDIAHFWSRVERRGPDECWLWMGSKNSRGYGQVYLSGKRYGAHRIAFSLARGPVASKLFVCHTCDTPGCVRPDHLFLGTQADNIGDAVQKGRMATGDRHGTHTHPERTARGDRSGPRLHPEAILRGSKSPRAKLNEDDVREIRHLVGTMTKTEMGKRYGVSRHAIRSIVRRDGWKHVAEEDAQ